MSQDRLIIWLMRAILAGDVASLAVFVAVYTALAPWWRSPIGRTIVIKDILLAVAFTPLVLSLFFTFSQVQSRVAAWLDIALLGAIIPVMAWRTAIWRRVHHQVPPGDAERGHDDAS